MAKKKQLHQKDVSVSIERTKQRVFTPRQLEAFCRKERSQWKIAPNCGLNELIDQLLSTTKLQCQRFNLPYRPETRYWWGDVPTLEIIQSLRPEGYFSHFSAARIHELTNREPDAIYLNFEQNLAGGGGVLVQEAIDRTFRGKCRVSNNVATFRKQRVCILNGRKTGHLGVEDIQTDEGANIRLTNIERTLIDVTVRPIYCGGPAHVAEIFATAKGCYSVEKLVSYLRELNYTYPYHQAIGFYMNRAGYPESELELLRQFEARFDFYLDYKMGKPAYVLEWKIYVPKELV